MISYFYVWITIKKFHLDKLKHLPLKHNSIYFHNKAYHIKLTISLS